MKKKLIHGLSHELGIVHKIWLTMRLIVFLFFVSLVHVSASVYSQKTKLNIKVENATLQQVFDLIQDQSEFDFFYKNEQIPADARVSVDAKNETIEAILNKVLKDTGLKFGLVDKDIVIIPIESTVGQQQKKTISGKVTDSSGATLPGVSVVVKGTTTGVITDNNGSYSLSNVPENAILQFSFVGMKMQEIVVGSKTSISVILTDETIGIDEVVAIGYGTQKKVNLTGSVATVNPEILKNIPAGNLSNALSGRLSGVRFDQVTGRPGASASISIRAESTTNNTAPLYVIDGVVRDKFAFDGLNATEIENISVLKDGASAAVYGSRAANGVILVTTLKGKTGKPIITYSGSVGISDATKIPEIMNAYDVALLLNEQARIDNYLPSDPRYYTEDELQWRKENQGNWNMLKEAWRPAMTYSNNLNISGGNEAIRYYVGGNYYYETGSFDNLYFSKYNFRSNLEANISKDLIATLNMNMESRNDFKPYWRSDNESETLNDMYKGLLLRGYGGPSYIDGKPNGTVLKWHPLELIKNGGDNNKKWANYEATASLQYNVPFIKGLSLKFMYNIYDRHTFIKQFCRPYTLYIFETTGTHNHILTDKVQSSFIRNDGDWLNEQYIKNKNYQLNGMITYKNKFGFHDVGALLVYEQSEGWLDSFNARANYFISSAVDQLFAGSADPKNSTVGGNGSETGRMSYVGRLNYGYKEKYLVEASFRYDGSVIFAPEERWGFFPSLSAGWRISEENFFKNNIRFIDYLKLKLSSGLLGNDAIAGWQWMQNYNITSGAQFGVLSDGLAAGVVPNPNVTWEKSFSNNVGFDAELLNKKMKINGDAFYRYTYDILGNRTASLPSTFGANMPSENYAKMWAKGIELEFAYNNKIGNNFKYLISGNFSYAVNKIIKRDEAQNLRPYRTVVGLNSNRTMGYVATDIIRTQDDLNALPVGYTIFGAKPELGMLNYKDIRGVTTDDPDGKIDDNDQDWIISYTTPPYLYGFSVGCEWKGFNLDLFFQGVAGSEKMIDIRGTSFAAEAAPLNFWKDFWTPENINASFPKPQRHQAGNPSTFWVRDESFLRFKNLNLSYTVPKVLASKMKVEQLKIFLTGTNLFLLQNNLKYYDPEINSFSDYPNMRNFSLGINVSL